MGMDLDKIAHVEPPVDEDALGDAIDRYLNDGPAPAWDIRTIGQADWAIRKIGEVRAREQEYRDQEALWQDARKRMTWTAEWLEERLMAWAIEQRTDRVKSQVLAHGTVRTTSSPARVVVVDEDAVIGWAREHSPDAIKTTVEVLVSRLSGVRLAKVIVAYESITHETGEVERVPTARTEYDPAKLDRLRARLGDGYTVTPELEDAVLDADGREVPGLGVKAETVSAKVTPLLNGPTSR